MKLFSIKQEMGRFSLEMQTLEGNFRHKLDCRTLDEAMRLMDFMNKHRKSIDMSDFIEIR